MTADSRTPIPPHEWSYDWTVPYAEIHKFFSNTMQVVIDAPKGLPHDIARAIQRLFIMSAFNDDDDVHITVEGHTGEGDAFCEIRIRVHPNHVNP